MTMKIAITNLANRTGDVLVVEAEDADNTIRLKRGESKIIDSQSPVSFSLRPEYAREDEYVGTPRFLVAEPPADLAEQETAERHREALDAARTVAALLDPMADIVGEDASLQELQWAPRLLGQLRECSPRRLDRIRCRFAVGGMSSARRLI